MPSALTEACKVFGKAYQRYEKNVGRDEGRIWRGLLDTKRSLHKIALTMGLGVNAKLHE